MKQFLIALIVLGSLILTGCPKAKKTVREFKEKSAEVTIYARNLNQAFNKAFIDGVITRDELRLYGTVDTAFGKALAAYRAGIEAAEKVVNETGELPKDTILKVDRLLDSVVTAFLDLTVKLGVMSFAQSETVRTILRGIQMLLLSLKAFVADARGAYGLEVNYV